MEATAKTILVSISAVGLMATAPASASIVVVRDYAAVADCQALGEVRGASLLGGLWANTAYNRTIEQLKQRAAALGGTHVQIVDSASGHSGARMVGTAFKCSALQPAPLPSRS